MNIVDFATLPAIIALCYFVGYVCKSIGNEKLDRFIPSICAAVGMILGIVTFLTIPSYIPADNWLEALAVGVCSGFAATGINQAIKQIKKGA